MNIQLQNGRCIGVSTIALLLILLNIQEIYSHDGFARDNVRISKAFLDNGVVPDVISIAPIHELKVTYNEDLKVALGNELMPAQVKDIPKVQWSAENDSYYTLIMTDPDAPSRAEPKFREWFHWVVVNIPGNDVTNGEALAEYIGAGPPPDTGLHRYVILVFKQKSKHAFSDETKLTNTVASGREQRSVSAFAKKHHLGSPVAGNFFQAKYDDYVPTLYKQLGL